MAAWHPALVLVALSAAPALADPLEVGGYVARTWSRTHDFYHCPPPTDRVDVCVSESEPHYALPAISAGGYARYPLTLVATAEADLLYTQKGINDGPNGVAFTFHYLEVPLLLEAGTPRKPGRPRVFALGGVAPAVRIACTGDGTRFNNDTSMAEHYSGGCPQPYGDPTPRRFDLDAVLGAGVGWDSPVGAIDVQLRFERGLVDIMDSAGRTINETWFLMLGYGRALQM